MSYWWENQTDAPARHKLLRYDPCAKSQGIKQLMAGGGIVVLGTTLIPLLSTLF
jgi:hypothetical protein